jgi:hypothetical protein
MTPHEFVLWFKGFAQAASDYTLTPAQWDLVKEQLDKVYPTSVGGYTISLKDGTYGTTTTAEKRNDITYKQDELSTNTVF